MVIVELWGNSTWTKQPVLLHAITLNAAGHDEHLLEILGDWTADEIVDWAGKVNRSSLTPAELKRCTEYVRFYDAPTVVDLPF